MTRYDKRLQALAVSLSAVAGFVDGTGFVLLGGFFVSFMSGNTTRLGVGIAHSWTEAATAIGLIAAFIVGVAIGSSAGHAAGKRRRPAVLLLVAVLLALAALAGAADLNSVAAAAMATAMGAENAAFESEGEVHIGLTYMTGTLVKIGQRLAAALRGGDGLAWVPYFALWLALAAGAAAGAALFPHLGLASLWIAASAMALLGLIAAAIEREG